MTGGIVIVLKVFDLPDKRYFAASFSKIPNPYLRSNDMNLYSLHY